MNKITRLGSLLFALGLLGYSAIKYNAGSNRVAIYYLIAGIGFLLIYISYRKKDRSSK